MWLERGRPEKAEQELLRALASDPENGELKADLARCMLQLERVEEALVFAREAIAAEPEWAYPRIMLAAALLASNRAKEAERIALEAIELDPELPALYALLATTLGAQKRWKESLAAAEKGLELDPENERCLNDRGQALTHLGRREQAAEGLQAALRRDPENPETHLNLGWNALHGGQGEEAIRHFREALRLDPELDAARSGLVEAMKSRTGLYRPFLAWFLFLGRIPTRTAFLILIGSVFARRYLATAARENPSLGVVLWPLFYGIVAFILMSWIASPLFDLVLRLSRDGKYALSEREIFNSNCLGSVLLLAIVLLLAGFAGVPAMYVAAGLTGAWAIPLTRALHATGRKRLVFHRLAAAGLLLIGIGAISQRYLYESSYRNLSPEIQELGSLPTIEDRMARISALAPEDQESLKNAFEIEKVDLETCSTFAQRSEALLAMYMWGFVILTWIP